MLRTASYTRIKGWQLIVLSAMMAVCMSACSKNTEIEPVVPIVETGDPISFGSASSEQSAATKASSLSTGFLVSAYKGNPQTEVMGKYEVIHKSDAWYNTSTWGYVGGTSDGFYQTQIERYWDYAKFPYHFNAIAPCPEHSQLSSFTLSDQALSIPSSVTYTSQTASVIAGTVQSTAGAEPFTVAQVRRIPAGNDYDLILAGEGSDPGKEINTGSASLNRKVALPFHHLTSRVRFGIYCSDHEETDKDLPITDVVVKVTSANFVTGAKGYNANLTSSNMIGGSFGSLVKNDNASGDYVLLSTVGASSLTGNNLSNCVDQRHAYMCELPDGLLQIPQEDVQISVSFKVGGKMIDDLIYDNNASVTYDDVNHVTVYDNIPLTITVGGSNQNKFTWTENNIYSYYMVVSRFFPLAIQFTASLEAWDDIAGSLETDLEK